MDIPGQREANEIESFLQRAPEVAGVLYEAFLRSDLPNQFMTVVLPDQEDPDHELTIDLAEVPTIVITDDQVAVSGFFCTLRERAEDIMAEKVFPRQAVEEALGRMAIPMFEQGQ